MIIRKPTFYLNADSSTGGGSDKSDGESNPGTEADAKDKTPDSAALAAENAKLREERDSAKKRERLANEKLRDIESKKSETERTKAAESGDVTALRESFQSEKTEWETEKQSLQNQLKTREKRDAFLKSAHLFHEATRDDVWRLVADDLDTEETDDGFRVVVKNSHLTVDEYLKQFADKKPHYAINPGKAGSGSKGAGDSKGGGSELSMEEISRLPDKGAKYFKDNPGAAKRVLSGARLKSI